MAMSKYEQTVLTLQENTPWTMEGSVNPREVPHLDPGFLYIAGCNEIDQVCHFASGLHNQCDLATPIVGLIDIIPHRQLSTDEATFASDIRSLMVWPLEFQLIHRVQRVSPVSFIGERMEMLIHANVDPATGRFIGHIYQDVPRWAADIWSNSEAAYRHLGAMSTCIFWTVFQNMASRLVKSNSASGCFIDQFREPSYWSRHPDRMEKLVFWRQCISRYPPPAFRCEAVDVSENTASFPDFNPPPQFDLPSTASWLASRLRDNNSDSGSNDESHNRVPRRPPPPPPTPPATNGLPPSPPVTNGFPPRPPTPGTAIVINLEDNDSSSDYDDMESIPTRPPTPNLPSLIDLDNDSMDTNRGDESRLPESG